LRSDRCPPAYSLTPSDWTAPYRRGSAYGLVARCHTDGCGTTSRACDREVRGRRVACLPQKSHIPRRSCCFLSSRDSRAPVLASGVVRSTPSEVTRSSSPTNRADDRHLAAVRVAGLGDAWRESAHNRRGDVHADDHRRHRRTICDADEPSGDRHASGPGYACGRLAHWAGCALEDIHRQRVDVEAIGLSAEALNCPLPVEIVVAADEVSKNRAGISP
jgi:hypothetical protein